MTPRVAIPSSSGHSLQHGQSDELTLVQQSSQSLLHQVILSNEQDGEINLMIVSVSQSLLHQVILFNN